MRFPPSVGRRPFLWLAALAVITQAGQAQCAASWDPRFGIQGIDGWVYSATTFDDGAGPALYIGGSFAVAESAAGANVAKRAGGGQWVSPFGGIPSTPLAYGQVNPQVTKFATYDDGTGPHLYAARQSVYRLDGQTWTPLMSATSGIVAGGANAIVAFDDGTGTALYAAGSFQRPGGFFRGVVRWTGTDWLQVGGDFTVPGGPAQILDLAPFTDQLGQTSLYVAGGFSMVGAVAAFSIARWSGAGWTALGGGLTSDPALTVPGGVYALHAWNDGNGAQLYVSGSFAHAGPLPTLNLARWNGAAWSSIGNVASQNLFCLGSMTVNGNPTLFVGGENVTLAGGVPVTNIAAYNGTWSNPGGGITSSPTPPVTKVFMIHAFDDGTGEKLYVGGRFNRPGGQQNGENVTSWDGTSWAPVTSGAILWGGEKFEFNATILASPSIRAARVFDDGSGPALFVTGDFNRIGGVNANAIAKFNGQTWQALGTGLVGEGNALEVFDDGSGPKLYVGGAIINANGVLVNDLARWNGTTFSAAPGWGVSTQPIEALKVYDDGTGPALWVGRSCPSCPNPPGASYAVMKWTPTGFVPFTRSITLAPAFPPTVYSLEVLDWGIGPRLVVGGLFNNVGGAPASGIFAWDGANVDVLGGGFTALNGFLSVNTSTVFTGPSLVPRLIAGGRFGNAVASGQLTRCIAQWNGTQWTALGTGVNMLLDQGPEVFALRSVRDGVFDSLYVGGRFLDAGGVPVSNLARWDGAGWSDVGGGVRFVGRPIRSWVNDFVEADLGSGSALVALGAFNKAGPAFGAGLLAPWTFSRPSIALSQAFPGGPVSVLEANLVAGHEYFSVFSLEPCGGAPGSGPYVGLCSSDIQLILDQVALPAGAVPFHFIASGPTAAFGPYGGIPPLTVDALSFELTGLLTGCPSQITRFVIH